MTHKISIQLQCPECGFPVNIFFDDTIHSFLLYVCPKCQSNVVFYDNKIDVISDKMLSKLIKQKKLKMCGGLEAANTPKKEHITSDDVVNLKLMLESSYGVEDFLQKI